ncbi:MAG: hypothetical protein IK078_05625 [Lachnospiraceae bacterium]|nr:hypothetical protein [Lachnospiraceae bacterium]
MKKKILFALIQFAMAGFLSVNAFASPEDMGAVGTEAQLMEEEDLSSEAGIATVQLTLPVTCHQTEARSILTKINDFRADESMAWYWNSTDTQKIYCSSLSDMTYDYTLEEIAIKRAAELAIDFDHYRPSGVKVYDEAGQQTTYSAYGENIAYGYGSAESVFVAWREDNDAYAGQGHRRNMLNDKFDAVGIGCVEYDGCLYWVQVFGGWGTNESSQTSADNAARNVTFDITADRVLSAKWVFTPSTGLEVGQGCTIDLPDTKANVTLEAAKRSSYDTIAVPSMTITDTNIARIENGKIKGIKKGQTSLTCTGEVGGITISDSLLITVTDEVCSGSDCEDVSDDQLLPSWENYDYTFTAVDGSSVSSKASGKPKMLVFCTLTCNSCTYLLENLKKDKELYEGYDIDIVYMPLSWEDPAVSLEDIAQATESYSDAPVTYCSDTSSAPWGAAYDYKYRVAENRSVGTPFCILINTDNRIIDYCEGGKVDMAGWMQEAFSKKYETGPVSENTGGNNSGNTGGSSGGNSGGNTSGNSGGNAGGNTGGSGNTSETKPSWNNLEISFPSESGGTVSTTAAGKPKLLIFYQESCGNCNNMFSKMASDPAGSYDGIDILAVDIRGDTAEQLKAHKSKFAGITATFCSDSNSTAFRYKGLKDGQSWGTIGTPYCVLINKDNQVVSIGDAYSYPMYSWINYLLTGIYTPPAASQDDKCESGDCSTSKSNTDPADDEDDDDDFIIKAPGKSKLKKLKRFYSDTLYLTWKNLKAYGYEVQIASNSKFTKNKKKYNKFGTSGYITLTKKQYKKFRKKYCYVRIRAYHVDFSGKKLYGTWSAVKKIKIK